MTDEWIENPKPNSKTHMATPCNHAVGTADIEHHESILHESAVLDGTVARHVSDNFSEFAFCPYCGVSVKQQAGAMKAAIRQEWDSFWEDYKNSHGQAEMERARYRPYERRS